MRACADCIILAPAALATAGIAAWRWRSSATRRSRGTTADAPVDVTADRIEVQDRADRAIFVGNVQVRQAALTLDTQRLTVAYSGGGRRVRSTRLDASGGVTVRSPSETARGQFRHLRPRPQADHPDRHGPAQRGGTQINGQRLVIDLDRAAR